MNGKSFTPSQFAKNNPCLANWRDRELFLICDMSQRSAGEYSCLSTSESLWTGYQAITLTLTLARPSHYYWHYSNTQLHVRCHKCSQDNAMTQWVRVMSPLRWCPPVEHTTSPGAPASWPTSGGECPPASQTVLTVRLCCWVEARGRANTPEWEPWPLMTRRRKIRICRYKILSL